MKKIKNGLKASPIYEIKNETFVQNSTSPLPPLNTLESALKRPNSAISTSNSSIKTSSTTPRCGGVEFDNLNEEHEDDVSTLIDEETNSTAIKIEGIEENVQSVSNTIRFNFFDYY